MAHLSFEYSANLEPELDVQAFCDLMRDVMRDSGCLLYTSPSPRDSQKTRMPSSA